MSKSSKGVLFSAMLDARVKHNFERFNKIELNKTSEKVRQRPQRKIDLSHSLLNCAFGAAKHAFFFLKIGHTRLKHASCAIKSRMNLTLTNTSKNLTIASKPIQIVRRMQAPNAQQWCSSQHSMLHLILQPNASRWDV